MIRPGLLAKFNRESEDTAAAILELTYAADEVLYCYHDEVSLIAVETLFHAIRHLTSIVTAVTRTVASEAERDASPSGAELYRSMLRLELSRTDPEEI